MSRVLVLLTLLLAAVCLASGASMKLYKKVPGANKYRAVLIAVSSTVIPLDDLPTFTVSSHLGPMTETPPPGVKRPDTPTKLITAERKKSSSPLKKASIVELTKEQFNAH